MFAAFTCKKTWLRRLEGWRPWCLRRHAPYLQLRPDDVVRWAGGPIAVVDCFGILKDDDIRRYFELGCEVKALGRGHIQRIKEEVRSSREMATA